MKAVIYARYSSDSQREESIEGQLRVYRLCREKRHHGIAAFDKQHRGLFFKAERLKNGSSDQNG